jgi:hypothetical protein
MITLRTGKHMQDIYILNGLCLAQDYLLKGSSPPFEVLPLNYNYQNIRIVSTNILEFDGRRIVIQANGCDCGPQPLIRTGIVRETIAWGDSRLREALSCKRIPILNRELCSRLAAQTLVHNVILVGTMEAESERRLLRECVERVCRGKEVEAF